MCTACVLDFAPRILAALSASRASRLTDVVVGPMHLTLPLLIYTLSTWLSVCAGPWKGMSVSLHRVPSAIILHGSQSPETETMRRLVARLSVACSAALCR